jgi:ABC-2 type transport system ATP-binding protein
VSNFAIETVRLSKDFDGERVIDGLDIQVPEGSLFGLIGPNGAGKTTLIRMLLGSLKPTEGKGTILGRDITDPTGEVRREVGCVSDFQNMYPFFKVEEILRFCAQVYPNWDWSKCRFLIKTFGLQTNKLVRELSKGTKTLLSLVIALSMRGRVLILDEPTSSLDSVMKNLFMQLVLQEAATGETTILFSTHNLQDLDRIASHVAAIFKGKLLFSKSMDELRTTAKKIQAVFPNGLPIELRNLPQILRIEEKGTVYSLTVESRFSETLEKVKAFQPVYVEIASIGLEELFIHAVGKEGYGHAILE